MPTAATNITETLTELLSHLVRMPTVSSDHATNRAAMDWVEQQLEGLPLHINRLENKLHPVLVATTRRTKSPKLWLSGHMDVVPAMPAAFNPIVKDGRIYGRGSHDMKFAIACFIALLREIGPELSNYDLGLMLTSDEEVGGEDGVKWLVDEEGFRGGLVLNPDTGGSWDIEVGSKGIMWWDITATGVSAHASRPWQGVSAINRLLEFIEEIRSQLKPEPCGDDEHWHTTLNIGTIHGGTVGNQVADSATARLDIRMVPGTSTSDVTGWMDEAATKVPGIMVKRVLSYPAWTVRDRAAVNRFKALAKEVAGISMGETISHAASDARHFAIKDIPAVTPGPLGSGYHVPEEWVDIESLRQFYAILSRFVKEMSKV